MVFVLDNLAEKQPHIVTELNGEVYVLPVPLVRKIANGEEVADNQMTKVIARALVDLIDG